MSRSESRLARLRAIGRSLWGPIGLACVARGGDDGASTAVADEYDVYLIEAADRMRAGLPDAETVDYLVAVETVEMTLGARIDTRDRAAAVVAAIRADDDLWSDDHP